MLKKKLIVEIIKFPKLAYILNRVNKRLIDLILKVNNKLTFIKKGFIL